MLDSTIFHPQGGGQPADMGFITVEGDDREVKFAVEDVRLKDGLVGPAAFQSCYAFLMKFLVIS